MKTEDLISAMAADAKSTEMPIARTLWLAVAAGTILAAILFFVEVGPRADLTGALSSPRFLFKCALTLMLLISAMGLVRHLARPGSVPIGWVVALAAVPAVLGVGVITEMLSIPSSVWDNRIFGMNWRVCMWLIPLLSAAPLVAVIIALRHGAPTHPILSGAAAGLLSAGIGATLYATHCQSDSPLFVAVWYVAATLIVTLVGAILGARLLRW
jgi:hypothetical protein